MRELTKARQGDDDLVVDFIYRLRSLILNCKDSLGELSSIEMFIQGMNWGLHYILQGQKPNTFEVLETRAHEMELSMTLREDQHLLSMDLIKIKLQKNSKGGGGKSATKDELAKSMYIQILFNA